MRQAKRRGQRPRGRLLCLLLLTLAAGACSPTAAGARVAAKDAAATHAYLDARIALNRAQAATDGAYLNAIDALAATVKAECPGVLIGATPRVKGERTNQSEFEVSQEIPAATFGAGDTLEHPADARFASAVRHLRWSDPRLTRLLRSLATEQAEQSAIPPPDLCSDMKFWVASDYRTTSPGTRRFVHRHEVVSSITQIESEPNEPVSLLFNVDALVAHRLKPYENHADRVLSRTALPREGTITGPALTTLFDAIASVYAALGRTPAPAA